jgi:CarD family transcriptional regulator
MLKFKKGELVLHRFFGTGTITGTQTVELRGTSQLYYVIELVTGGTLMVPLQEADEARLHPLISPEMIVDVLSTAPQELADNVSVRRDDLDANINRGDPTRVTEMLRDLTWRDQSNDLSQADKDHVKQAKRLLTSLLVAQPDLDARGAARRLDAMLERTIGAWNA